MNHEGAAARLAGDGVLLLITMVWGFTFVAVKDAVAKVPVFTFLAMRFGLAVLALAGIMAWETARRARGAGAARAGSSEPGGTVSRWESAWPGLLTGLFLFGGYALQTVGLQYTTPGKAGFITGLSVVLVPVLDGLAFRRAQQPAALVGVGLAAAGMGLMFLEGADWAVRRGDVLVLLCAVAFAAHVTAVANLSWRGRLARFSFWQAVVVFALSAALAPFERWRAEGFDGAVVATLLLTGVLVSGIFLVLQVWGQRRTSATHAAVIFALEPVFAGLAGWALVGETFTTRTVLGSALILAGMLAAEAPRLCAAPKASVRGRIWGTHAP